MKRIIDLKNKIRKGTLLLLGGLAMAAAVPAMGQELFSDHPQAVTTPTPVPSLTPAPDPEIPVDFDRLKELNDEVYAWIYIPGTSVDYPVVMSRTDADYYLTHDFEKKESVYGAIFAQANNQKDFLDPMTVLYGHNMNNGSMFASLHNYESQSFFDSNRTIYIYKRNKIYTYEVFAAYDTSSDHLLNTNDFSTQEGFQAYIDSIYDPENTTNSGFISTTYQVTTKDHLLALSTCTSDHDENRRYVVQAYLKKVVRRDRSN